LNRQPIQTLRLRLLPGSSALFFALVEGAAQFEKLVGFRAAAGLRDFAVSGEVSPEWIDKVRTGPDSDPWLHGFCVLHVDSASIIGNCGFKGPPDAAGMVEIAYGVVPAFEGQGFATEVAEALVAYASADERVRLIRAHTFAATNASTRVLTKCGFEYAGDVMDPEDGRVARWERKPIGR